MWQGVLSGVDVGGHNKDGNEVERRHEMNNAEQVIDTEQKTTSTTSTPRLFLIGNPHHLGFKKNKPMNRSKEFWWEDRWGSAVHMVEQMIFRYEKCKEHYTLWYGDFIGCSVGYIGKEETKNIEDIIKNNGIDALATKYGDVLRYWIPPGGHARTEWNRMLDLYIEHEEKEQGVKKEMSKIAGGIADIFGLTMFQGRLQ